jgi:hypothetical protein
MGGEPFLNPTLANWVQGLNLLFGIEIQILTNGSRFSYAKDLYQHMLYRSPQTQALNHVGVSLHNLNDFEKLDHDIREWLDGPVKMLPKGQNLWNSDWHYIDRNGIMVNVYVSNNFGNASIKVNEQGRFKLHNSNIDDAHQNCAFVKWKSYHFIRGKLYKCGPVALMPEFDKQYAFHELSEEDRVLLNSYCALDPNNFAEYHEEFFAKLDNPIAQCKFCPTTYDAITIYPVRKGAGFK